LEGGDLQRDRVCAPHRIPRTGDDVTKSTTGAYAPYPDYYYESGNLFGSFLLGHTPPMSSDTKHDVAVEGGGILVTSHSTKKSASRRQAHGKATSEPIVDMHTLLMEFVRRVVGKKGARRILESLALARGVEPPRNGNAFDLLDRFVIEHLTQTQQTVVLERLAAVIANTSPPTAGTNGRGNKAKPRQRRGNKSQQKDAKPAKHNASPASTKPREATSTGVSSRRKNESIRVCAFCGIAVTEADQRRCELQPVFLGNIYCSAHASKIESLLTG
jgi:hypothetical protein